MVNESSVKDIINNSLEQIKTVIDANTVVGNQITTPSGTVIIPISKLSMGFASGGLDLPTKNEGGVKNFGGGGGTGVTVMPIGFLTVYPDGKVEMLPLNAEKSSPIEQVADILDHTPDIISRIKDVITGNTSQGKDMTDEEEEEARKLEEKYSEQLVEEIIEPLSKKELRKIQKAEAKEEKAARKLAKRADKL